MKEYKTPNNTDFKIRFSKLNWIDRLLFDLIWIDSNAHFFISGIFISLALGSIPSLIESKFDFFHTVYILLISILWLVATYGVYRIGSISDSIQKKAIKYSADQNANIMFEEFEKNRPKLKAHFISTIILTLLSIVIIVGYISFISCGDQQVSDDRSASSQVTEIISKIEE